ncbi:hypothetical protein QBC39DRAFT_337873 [Podospora conica]|nr:hypothetical protein QBC39DRAFT_337873 [Schizothecium conicum]
MLVTSVRAAHRSRGIKQGPLDAAGRLQSAALLSHQTQQQTRGFRFGWYRASYGSPEPRPDDMYRRCRKFRYKYTSSIVRDTTPGRTVLVDDADSTAKRFGLWRMHGRAREHSHKAQCAGGRTPTPGNPEGVRPGQNIEDVERAPMESLIFGTTQQSHANTRGTPLPDAEAPFTIDPITNRKVYGPRSSPAGAGSVSKVAGFSRTNKPDFESLRPPHIDDARSGTPFEAPPILESEQYLADLAGFPSARDILGVNEKDVSWHPAEGLAASATLPPSNGNENHLDHQTLNQRSHQYDDLHKYGPVDFAEPDGQIAPETWDHSPTQQYEDVDKYGAVRSHEPDGRYKETSESTVDPGELEDYKPVRSHEPDGKYKEKSEPTLDTSELKKYRPVRSHEPDGKYKEKSEPTLDTSELKKYRPVRSHEPDGKYKERPEPTVDPSELENYQPFRSHEPDGKYNETSEPAVDPRELENYQPFRSNEPDGKYKQDSEFSVDPSELAKYRPFRAHEPDGMYAAAQNSAQPDLKKDYPNLEWYNHGLFSHEPDGKYAAATNERVVETSDLSSYGAFRSHEPDGMYAAEAAKPTPAQVLEGESFEYDMKGLEASGATPEEKTYYRQMVESLMARSAEEESTAAAAEMSSSPKVPSKDNADRRRAEKKVLTGNYSRDFPEEFARSWTTKDNSTLLPTDIEQTVGNATAAPTPSPTQPPSDLQPALDRYSKPPTTSAPATPSPPTLYKILTHDPTTNLITTTSTTSTVPPSTPLTPAEVLVRVSHPAKFIPHFAALEAQGFELVSGADDVLVFRKVGDGTPPGGDDPPVNPIDMMGKPVQQQRREYYATAAERFASPTGFVNYDLPQQHHQMRRVEEVFSGPKEEAEKVPVAEKGGKKGVGKRLAVGAAWVAAVSYSIGVVGDVLGKGGL